MAGAVRPVDRRPARYVALVSHEIPTLSQR
jgi:hypothetical protein